MPRRPRLAVGDLAYAGTRPVYQGRYKSFPLQTNTHFLMVARYVERNAIRATLVSRAEDWRWGECVSADPRRSGIVGVAERLAHRATARLDGTSQPATHGVGTRVVAPECATRASLRCGGLGRPAGYAIWMESTVRPRGRPRGS